MAARSVLAELATTPSYGLGEALFTCHEAFHLPYEASLVRHDGAGAHYASSAHFLWVGERTNDVDDAHVAFLRRVANPLGVKVGPRMTPSHLVALLRALDPDAVPGRVTLITRLGTHVHHVLPALVNAVRDAGHPVLWVCDPMHGNTQTVTTPDGGILKTRAFDDVLRECVDTLAIHRQLRSVCTGLHVEVADTHVTECSGGITRPVAPHHVAHVYLTKCDPRLNPTQALDLMRALVPHLLGNVPAPP